MNVEENSRALGLTVEEYNDLLALFAVVGMTDFQKLRAAMEHGDSVQASSLAHSLKGAAGSLGLTVIYELAANTERLLNCGRFEEAAVLIQSLEKCMFEFAQPA